MELEEDEGKSESCKNPGHEASHQGNEPVVCVEV
jgi:hypothetical protein